MGKRGLTKIQIQHLLKLNKQNVFWLLRTGRIQIQHLLKLNLQAKNLQMITC